MCIQDLSKAEKYARLSFKQSNFYSPVKTFKYLRAQNYLSLFGDYPIIYLIVRTLQKFTYPQKIKNIKRLLKSSDELKRFGAGRSWLIDNLAM